MRHKGHTTHSPTQRGARRKTVGIFISLFCSSTRNLEPLVFLGNGKIGCIPLGNSRKMLAFSKLWARG